MPPPQKLKAPKTSSAPHPPSTSGGPSNDAVHHTSEGAHGLRPTYDWLFECTDTPTLRPPSRAIQAIFGP